jgi:hypothetical protein
MMDHYASAARHILGRGLEPGDGNMVYQLPPWGWVIVAADFIVFLPVLVFLGYTLGHVYPTLAIVEDPSPPAYEPVSLEEPDIGAEDSTGASAPRSTAPTPITSSLRRINGLIYSLAGWKSNFRGAGVAFTLATATALLSGVLTAVPFVGPIIGTFLTSLILVQLSTAWVHIVISPPNKLPFWHRLLPFRKVFEATCFPVLLAWAARSVAQFVPLVVAHAMGVPVMERPGGNQPVPPNIPRDLAWKVALVVIPVSLALNLLFVIPSTVVLVRVQASLLPPEEDAVIPFDRSYGGTVEPAVVGGKGYVTIKNALKTFKRSSWIRLYVLYIKIFVVSLVLHALLFAVIIPQIFLFKKTTNP